MKRIAEPELMNDPAQVHAYATADFEQPHTLFIELFCECFAELQSVDSSTRLTALDLGCGPADISRRLVSALENCEVHAVDGAANMISMAATLNHQQGLDQRIKLFTSCINDVSLPQQHYDVIISNSLLHHLHDPFDLWKVISRYSRPGTRVFVMDLLRPETIALAKELVETHAASETAILRQDFYHSLCAAYRIDEVEDQLHQCGIDYCQLRQVSDRHLIVCGVVP